MFSFTSIVTIALSAISVVNGLAIPRDGAPSTYNEGYLENYDVYHARYMALGCENKHNTDFFDACCHPLLATETLATRPAECSPASAVAASAAPSPTQAPNNVAPSPDVTPSSSSSHTPSSSHAAPAATPSTSPNSDAGSGQQNSGGFATFFYQGGQAGACGTVHSDNDLIAAIDENRYGDSSRKSSLCGKKVHLTNTKNGKSVTVTIADDCPTCVNSNSIDLSVGAFQQIATEEEGMVPIVWSFV